MKGRSLNIALIGCGYWGKNFLRIIQNSETAQLVAVCDINLDHVTKMSAKHPHVFFTNELHTLLNNATLDAVVICTPTATHYTIVEMFLQAGKHVLCEKPLTNNYSQANALNDLAKARGLILMVGHVFEFNLAVQKMKELISQNQIGVIQYMQFARFGLGPIREDVSVVFDLASHDVSIALSLMQCMPIAVSASGACFFQKEIEDVAFILLEFPNQIFASINISWIDPIKQRLVKVVGSKKMLLFDDVSISEKLKIIETGKNYQPNTGDFGSFQLAVKDGEINIPNLQPQEPLVTEFNHFVSCINQKVEPITNGKYASDVVKVLVAAETSIKNNGGKVLLA
jgi:predicted dehydrogenase